MACNFLSEMLETVELNDIYEQYWSNIRIPIAGAFELTFGCNLSCIHCYAASGRKYSDLALDDIKRIVDQLAEGGNLFLSLTGGEPLLREDFPDIYKYVKKKGIMVEVLTNGTLIDDKIIDLFCDYPPVKLDISMYGMTKSTYENITRVKGSFEKFISALNLLMNNNIRFDLKTVVLSTNKNEVLMMKEFAKEMGVGFRYSYNITPMIDGNSSTIRYRLTPAEAIEFDTKDEERRQFWLQMKHYKPKHMSESKESYVYFCKAGKNVFHIDATGKLFACAHERCHGYDLLKGSFSEGWNRHIVSAIRDRKASERYPCFRCEYYKFCDHCPAVFELENGDPEIPSSFRCEVAKMRAKIS